MMDAKLLTTHISERLWRSLPRQLRAEVMKHLWRHRVVRDYAANVAAALRAHGEYDLARRFLQTLGTYAKRGR